MTPGQAVMAIEEVIYAICFLESLRGSFPRFLHFPYVPVIVKHAGEEVSFSIGVLLYWCRMGGLDWGFEEPSLRPALTTV